ncbi:MULTISPECIES: hypothetical protein [unclassified Myroides]|uniref:hypothetical protein n=1 Tax=unclassified Myroides TaxID=2642485 RepID=UPI003D2F64A3
MSSVVLNSTRKGRNEGLIQKRNQQMVARFYFYSTLMALKFSTVLELLEQEFFLSQARITDLLAENAELITTVELKQISISELRDSYPSMNWQYNHAKRSQTAGQISLDLF